MTRDAPPVREIGAACVFCGANVGTRAAYAAAAHALGALLARENVALVYGGGSVGLMNEAANATLRAGGEVIGVITRALMDREVGHAGLTTMHVVETMHERKKLMADLSDLFVALPGGYGTFDELCEMLTWNQLGIHEKPVVIVNVDGFFDGFLLQLDRAVQDRLLTPANRTMLLVVQNVEDTIEIARRWQPPPSAPKWFNDPVPQP